MPREGRFFALFDQHAEFIVQGATVLVELLRDFDNTGSRDARVARILELEHAQIASLAKPCHCSTRLS